MKVILSQQNPEKANGFLQMQLTFFKCHVCKSPKEDRVM